MLRSRCRRIPTNSQSPSSCRWSPTCHALPHTPPHQQPVCASTASAAKLGEAAAAAHPTNTSGTHTVRTLMLPQPVSFPQELRKVSVERSGPKQATAIKESALPASLVPERRKSPAATATPMITSANISENLSAILMCVPGERYISIFGGACLSAPPRDCFLRPTHGATPCALCTPPCLARVVQMAMAAQRAPTDACSAPGARGACCFLPAWDGFGGSAVRRTYMHGGAGSTRRSEFGRPDQPDGSRGGGGLPRQLGTGDG